MLEIAQSCPTLCDPVGGSLPGSSLHGILQARVLEWVAISFSRGSSQLRDWTRVSCIPGRSFNLWATREASLCNSSFWGAMLQIVACCWPLIFFFYSCFVPLTWGPISITLSFCFIFQIWSDTSPHSLLPESPTWSHLCITPSEHDSL